MLPPANAPAAYSPPASHVGGVMAQNTNHVVVVCWSLANLYALRVRYTLVGSCTTTPRQQAQNATDVGVKSNQSSDVPRSDIASDRNA